MIPFTQLFVKIIRSDILFSAPQSHLYFSIFFNFVTLNAVIWTFAIFQTFIPLSEYVNVYKIWYPSFCNIVLLAFTSSRPAILVLPCLYVSSTRDLSSCNILFHSALDLLLPNHVPCFPPRFPPINFFLALYFLCENRNGERKTG